MGAIELPDDFDFSKDQHKLLLKSDLEAMRSAITTLRKRVDDLETSERVPALRQTTFTPVASMARPYSYISTAMSGHLTYHAPAVGALGGIWSCSADTVWVDPTSYGFATDPGTEFYRCAASFFVSGTNSGASRSLTWETQFRLPDNFNGFGAPAITWDLRLQNNSGLAGDAYGWDIIWTTGEESAGSAVASGTQTGNGNLDSGWTQLSLSNSDFTESYAGKAGGWVNLQLRILYIDRAQFTGRFGHLTFNWK